MLRLGQWMTEKCEQVLAGALESRRTHCCGENWDNSCLGTRAKLVGASRVDGPADLLSRAPSLAKGDSQVLGTIGFQKGHLAGGLLCCLILGADEVKGRTLSFCLK